MKPEPVKSSELDRLIQRYLDGLLDEAERARLEGILRSSPEAARQLARTARFERLIERHMRQPVPVAPLLRPAPVRWWPIASWRRWREHAWGPLVAVALHAVLFAALIRWVIWPASSRRGDEVEITM